MDGGKRSAWIKHVMKHKKAGMSLGDAMKAAKKTWKGGADSEPAPVTGGMLQGTVAGGRRRTRKHKGGALYGFAGGPYTGSPLADGAVANGTVPAMQWEGASPSAAQNGGRRRKSRKMTKKAGRRRGSRKH